jgi:hypothetical protein
VRFSPQANYDEWATATCRRILVPTFADRGVSCGQRGENPTAVNSVFKTGAATSLSRSSPFILSRLSEPRFRLTATQKIW